MKYIIILKGGNLLTPKVPATDNRANSVEEKELELEDFEEYLKSKGYKLSDVIAIKKIK